jgi:hypothetical protein
MPLLILILFQVVNQLQLILDRAQHIQSLVVAEIEKDSLIVISVFIATCLLLLPVEQLLVGEV